MKQDTYDEMLVFVYHPIIKDGELTRNLNGAFKQVTSVVFDAETGIISNQYVEGQVPADIENLQAFIDGNTATLVADATNLKANFEAQLAEEKARGDALEAELDALKTAVAEAL